MVVLFHFGAGTPTLVAVVLFTKIWTAVLAVLATACLAGMYLLSTGSTGGFTEADKTAVRAVTEAGIAALASDINSSPVSLGPSLLSDTRLQEALAGPAIAPADDPDAWSLQDAFGQVANEGLLNDNPRMSMAIVDKAGNILARTGLAPDLFDELVKLPAFSSSLSAEEPELLSATLDGKLHAVKLSRPIVEAQQRRLVTISAVELGGGSFFRRVVGTQNPAGIVRDSKILGDVIGGAKDAELVLFVQEHLDDLPKREGASQVFMVGEGADARIGAAARVPGPAGRGNSGTLFVVLSSHTLGSTQQDMATALRTALATGGLGQLNWPLVGGLLLISLGLTFYLPFIEFNTPMRRLAGEFNALTEGRQHEIHHDTYGGEFGRLARAAMTALDALRVHWESEWLDADAGLDPGEGGGRRSTRSTRSLRSTRGVRRPGRTRGHQSVAEAEAGLEGDDQADDELSSPTETFAQATPELSNDPESIELPRSDSKAPIERHAAADTASRAASRGIRPAPAFSDDIDPGALPLGDSSDSVSLADVGGPGDDREAYYRRIYDEFVETKIACGESTEGFTYDKFAKKLRKQSDSLLGREDVSDVQFSVYVKDGKAALRAKVIKV